MRMGIGLGVGINRSNYAQGIFSAYQSRVTADGGVTEAGGCVDAVSGLLLTASLLLIPSGYKSGKAYAQIPTNGNGDLTWTRASSANRTNSSGNIELMATGVPRLSYMYGSCPAVLLEPQRTNGVRNSVAGGAVAGTPGTNPTNWTINTQTGLTKEIVGTGTENGLPYVDVRYSGTPTAGPFFLIAFEGTNVIAATSGQTWAYSFYYKKISGTIPTNSIQLVEYNASGVFLAAGTITGNLNTITTLTRISETRTLSNALTAFTGVQIRIDASVGTAYDFTMRFYAPQIELGAYSTTWITTNGASATRVADTAIKTGISSLIGQSSGTLFASILPNPNTVAFPNVLIRTSFGEWLGIGSIDNKIRIFSRVSGGAASVIFTSSTTYATGSIVKVAIKYTSTFHNIFINGASVSSGSITMPSSFDTISFNGDGAFFSIGTIFNQQIALFTTALTDAECVAITT